MKKYLIIIILLLIGIPILINEVVNRPKYNLIKDANNILNNVESYKSKNNISLEEILINNEYELDKKYKVNGEGVIIIDNTVSLFLSRDNMCIMKLDSSSKLLFQKEKCPVYRMFNGLKEKIVFSGSGLYESNDSYIYKGKNSSNLLIYEDSLWYILEINKDYLKIVSLTSRSNTSYLTEDEYNNTLSDDTFLVKNMIGNEVKSLNTESLKITGSGLINDPLMIK